MTAEKRAALVYVALASAGVGGIIIHYGLNGLFCLVLSMVAAFLWALLVMCVALLSG